MKKIKMIICDMDGTLVNYSNKPFNSTWDVFPEILSEQKRKKWVGNRDFYLAKIRNEENKQKKKELYEEWFNKHLNLLKNLSVEEAYSSFFPIPYSKGVESFFSSLNGEYIKGILSSGIGFVAEKIKNDLNFDFQSSSDLETEKGKFTGRGQINFDLSKKDKAIISIAQKYKINLEEICYIGDHFNDVPAWEVVGLSVAFNPKEKELEKKVNYVIYDFCELNKILKNKKWTKQTGNLHYSFYRK